MSIATELQRIKLAKEALKQAINAKGGTLTDEKLDAYAEAVSGLSTGGFSDAYVAVEVDGVLKAQKLAFDGTVARDDGSPEEIGTVGIYATNCEEPAYKGSGGGSFYKCASVDGGTWSGYKAVQSGDGAWDFDTVVTENTYGNGYTPEVGKIYNSDATVKIESLFGNTPIPTDYRLYIPFNTVNTTAETGQSIDIMSGSLSIATKNGLPMTCFDTNTYAKTRLDSSRGDYDQFHNSSWSFWYSRENDVNACELLTSNGTGNDSRTYISNEYINFSGASIPYNFEKNKVYHICIVANNFTDSNVGNISYYINGKFIESTTPVFQYTYPPRNLLYFHAVSRDGAEAGTVSYFAGFRFYDRCITEEEVKALSKEFIPVTE